MNRPVERCGDGPPIVPRKGIGSTTGVSVSSTAGPGATVKLDARFCWMGNGRGGNGIEGLAFGQNLIRNFAQFADYVEPGEHLKAVESDVHFPPVETLARAGQVVMMVVVSALAEGHQRQQPVVLAGIGGWEPPLPEEVRQRVDAKYSVPQQYSAQAESRHEQASVGDQKHPNAKHGDRHPNTSLKMLDGYQAAPIPNPELAPNTR